MSKEIHKLYIDESGSPDPNHPDKNYTISGVIIRKYQCEELKIKADQIKFKYWGKTDIVFHSREIGKAIGNFSILKDKKIAKDFYKDLMMLINSVNYKLIIVSINKDKLSKPHQKANYIQSIAFEALIKYFLHFLDEEKLHGQIFMETSGGHDIELHKKFTSFLSHGIDSIAGKTVRDLLTSISFVNKNNHDIETQIADIFAYPATQHFLDKEGIIKIQSGSYEDKIRNTINFKLINIRSTGEKSIIRLP